MELGRRQLLGLGAGALVAVAASACRAGDQPSDRAGRLEPSQQASPTASGRPRPQGQAFPGQPAPGRVYYGATLPHYRSLPEWEAQLGATLAVNRSFFAPVRHQPDNLVACCLDDLEHDRLPHVSTKPRGTWQEIAAGGQDAWLEGMLAPLRDTGEPILFTLHHEPENDAGRPGMQPADFVAMQRHLIDLAGRGGSGVVVVPVLQQWTFDPLRVDIDPTQWLVPEASVLGLDVYNHWSPTNGKPWRGFGSKVDEVLEWIGDVPLVIGEYGCREDPLNPGLAAEWLRDAADYARDHDVVAMSYYNSRVNAPEGTWELTPSSERVFAEMLTSDWVAREA